MGTACCTERFTESEFQAQLGQDDQLKPNFENVPPLMHEKGQPELLKIKETNPSVINKTQVEEQIITTARVYRSGTVLLNTDNFSLERYEREEYDEKFYPPPDLESKLPASVLTLVKKLGRFRFSLYDYPGKGCPVFTSKDKSSGEVYYGQVLSEGSSEEVREGKGFLLRKGAVYSGYFSKDAFEGPGLLIFFQGGLSYYKGFWVSNSLNGNGILSTEAGYYYQGEWKDSLQDGYGEETWPDGSSYKGDFKQGVKWGHGEFIWPGGERYVGQFRAGELEGYGTFEWPQGNRYQGNWKEGKSHGQGKFIWSDGTVYEGNYVNGKKEGFGVLNVPGQHRWEGQWANGKKEGKGVFFTTEGDRISGVWSADVKKSL